MSSANDSQPSDPQETGQAESRGSAFSLKSLLVIAAIAVASGVAGVTAVSLPVSSAKQVAGPGTPDPTPDPSDEAMQAAEPVILDLGNVIVNVAKTAGRRYLKVDISIELRSQEVQDTLQSKIMNVRLKDLVNNILSAKTIDELDSGDERDELRRQIRDEANLSLDLNNGILRVYFTEFVVQ